MPTAAAKLPMPKGWIRAGDHPDDYEMGVDAAGARTGGKCGVIRSVAQKTIGFGTLMQGFKAGAYCGKRLRLTASIKAQDVKGWAGLWMRIDGPSPDVDQLGFDNMQDRPIKGTSDWARYSVVLDVPENADVIAFGVLLAGKGAVWIDDVEFEVVDKTVTPTDKKHSWANDEATNLDFEES